MYVYLNSLIDGIDIKKVETIINESIWIFMMLQTKTLPENKTQHTE